MGKIIAVNVGSSKVFIESSDVGYGEGLVEAGGIKLEKNLDKILDMLKPFSESIIRAFEGLEKKPDSATAEFGLSIGGEGNLFVVKATGEASIKVTLNWSLAKYEPDS